MQRIPDFLSRFSVSMPAEVLRRLDEMADALVSAKGVQHGRLTITTTTQDLGAGHSRAAMFSIWGLAGVRRFVAVPSAGALSHGHAVDETQPAVSEIASGKKIFSHPRPCARIALFCGTPPANMRQYGAYWRWLDGWWLMAENLLIEDLAKPL